MSCERFERLLALDIEGDLPAGKARRLSSHLAGCQSCQQFVERLKQSQAALKSLRHESVSEDALGAVRQRVIDEVGSRPGSPEMPGRLNIFHQKYWQVGLAGAAIGLLAVGGFALFWPMIRTEQQLSFNSTVPDLPSSLPGPGSIQAGKKPEEVSLDGSQYASAPPASTEVKEAEGTQGRLAPAEQGAKDSIQVQGQVARRQIQNLPLNGRDVVTLSELRADAVSPKKPAPEPAQEKREKTGKRADQPEDESWRYNPNFNTEDYDRIYENAFLAVTQNPLSTFSIDVDTASYSNVRRYLNQNQLPPKGSVRIEEMINYFSYNYPQPTGEAPFSVNLEINDCPWNQQHRLLRVGLKGREINVDHRPPSNLVFLLDVSGSMQPSNKLPLLKRAMKMLVERLDENDRVAIVVYAGASGMVLPSTPCNNNGKILAALDDLRSGGSTNGGAGIRLAYDTAEANFIDGGINRVILATDGDFNVGITNQGDLTRLIEEKAKSGIFLSVLGFGMGNYKDSTLEKLADKGNGNYAYIDTRQEAQKVLVDQMSGTLITIAKDVKIQIEFNPAQVSAYRLIGYENRMLRAEDFNDDKKDAGDIGAGHTVTALYEVVPVGVKLNLPNVDPLKYQPPAQARSEAKSGELLTVKLRYKEPDGHSSRLLQVPFTDSGAGWVEASDDFRFAAAVAAFGMILRDSQYKGNATFDSVLELARDGQGNDQYGYRAELIRLVRKAQRLMR